MPLPRSKLPILALLSTAQLIIILDFSVVNVALPSIQEQFGITQTTLQWVVSAYALTFGGFLLFGGRMSDVFDRKRVFMAGLVVFTSASLTGGLAPSASVVFLSRAVQGLGAALLSPSALSLVTTTFREGNERNFALGIFSSMAAIGFTLGVTLGGVLTSFISWHWVFFINVPIGIAAFIVGAIILPSHTREREEGGFDVTGAVLITTTMLIIVYSITQISAPGETLEGLLLLVVLAVITLGSFVYVETRAARPLVPLDVFRRRTMLLADLVMFVTYWANAALIFAFTLYLQEPRGFSPIETGLIFIPAGIGGVTGSVLAPRLMKRVGFIVMILVGLMLFAVSLVGLSTITLSSNLVFLMAFYFVGGVGLVSSIISLTVAATTGMEEHRQGLAAGMLNTAQQIGAAIGASMSSVVATAIALSIGTGPAAQTAGYAASILMSLMLTIIGVALTAYIIFRRLRKAEEGMPGIGPEYR